MLVFHNISEWLIFRRSLSAQVTVGFVPTMGNLHAGHASLVMQSKQQNQITVVSIFVNPAQFNRADDFKHYPRTLENDLALLSTLGVDYCLLPDEDTIYADSYCYQIQETRQSLILEGKQRPGHFTGVLTVVMKLLNLVRATNAYFGEKDYQQYQLIKGMASAFFMETAIQLCPIIREESGLAYSSRNNRLSPSQRIEAEKFARLFHQDKPVDAIMNELVDNDIQVEYLEEQAGRRFIAVMIDDIRLIDNYKIK